jgi:hypothetical protein
MAKGGGPGGGSGSKQAGNVIDVTGTSTDINTTVFDVVQARGLVGIGAIKNTGANSITIIETVTDKFGVTTPVPTDIPAGDQYILNPQSSFNDEITNSWPPYTEYKLEVQSTTAGQPSTFELHYIDVSPS